jgi:hypothetical protein
MAGVPLDGINHDHTRYSITVVATYPGVGTAAAGASFGTASSSTR